MNSILMTEISGKPLNYHSKYHVLACKRHCSDDDPIDMRDRKLESEHLHTAHIFAPFEHKYAGCELFDMIKSSCKYPCRCVSQYSGISYADITCSQGKITPTVSSLEKWTDVWRGTHSTVGECDQLQGKCIQTFKLQNCTTLCHEVSFFEFDAHLKKSKVENEEM